MPARHDWFFENTVVGFNTATVKYFKYIWNCIKQLCTDNFLNAVSVYIPPNIITIIISSCVVPSLLVNYWRRLSKKIFTLDFWISTLSIFWFLTVFIVAGRIIDCGFQFWIRVLTLVPRKFYIATVHPQIFVVHSFGDFK